jgi:hypothetical protein
MSSIACNKTQLQNFFLEPVRVVEIAILAVVDEVYYLVEPFPPCNTQVILQPEMTKDLW